MEYSIFIMHKYSTSVMGLHQKYQSKFIISTFIVPSFLQKYLAAKGKIIHSELSEPVELAKTVL